MRFPRRSATLMAAVVLLVGAAPSAGAASPGASSPSVKVTGNGNFHLEREDTQADGRVVANFRSPKAPCRQSAGRAWSCQST